ncbi:MAG: STAS domain-containing protein [Nannocystaceae bacterium]
MSGSLADRICGFEHSPFAVWVNGLKPFRLLWANKMAIELWGAPDIESLTHQDLTGTSETTLFQLDTWAKEMARGALPYVSLHWTIHPNNVPKHVHLIFSFLDYDEEGRARLLFQVLPKQVEIDPERARAGEALRHISASVVLLTPKGEFLTRNPAAMRTFGLAPLSEWFADPSLMDAILDVARSGDTLVSQVTGGQAAPERVFSLEARRTRDPIDGNQVVLLHLLDETQRVGAERDAQALQIHASELAQALATVKEQKAKITELSAPILPTAQGVLTVPLIGHLDTARMHHLSTRLLAAVDTHHTRRVVLDFTGANVEPHAGISAIARLIRAIRLLGAKVIITGIRAQLARDVVQSGVSHEIAEVFGGGETQVLASLADGIRACNRKR